MPEQADLSYNCDFSFARCARGRAVYAELDGTLYRSHYLDIYRSTDDGRKWQLAHSIRCGLKRRAIQLSRLACRLLRHEVRAFRVLSDGSAVASTRQGMFWAAPGEKRMQRARVESGGRPVAWPMTVSLLPGDQVIWGEYCRNRERREISLFASMDKGRSYHRVYTFDAGTIKHVHNIYADPSLDRSWVLVGDYGEEPGMGLLSSDFSDLQWVVRGEQRYRAVSLFDFGDHLIYGTDTEIEPNAIYRMDKATGRVERLAELDGSCIYGCRCGDYCVLSTTAEPSRINTDRVSSIWVSRDGQRWQRVFRRPKDMWPFKYFQYGTLVLPRGDSGRDVLLFSGQAVVGLDGVACVARLTTDAD